MLPAPAAAEQAGGADPTAGLQPVLSWRRCFEAMRCEFGPAGKTLLRNPESSILTGIRGDLLSWGVDSVPAGPAQSGKVAFQGKQVEE